MPNVAHELLCRHDPDTPVPLLCDDCRNTRRQVRDRINRRKARARKRGQTPRPVGTTTLPPQTTVELADALDYLTELLTETGQQHLSDLEQQLVYSLKHIRDTLEPALQQAADELAEIKRPITRNPDQYQGTTPQFALP